MPEADRLLDIENLSEQGSTRNMSLTVGNVNVKLVCSEVRKFRQTREFAVEVWSSLMPGNVLFWSALHLE
jgi:hypothetical protein